MKKLNFIERHIIMMVAYEIMTKMAKDMKMDNEDFYFFIQQCQKDEECLGINEKE